MLKIESASQYEEAVRRIRQLGAVTLLDGAETAEFFGLLAAVDEWEHGSSPGGRSTPRYSKSRNPITAMFDDLKREEASSLDKTDPEKPSHGRDGNEPR
jgi:hypothetical protein